MWVNQESRPSSDSATCTLMGARHQGNKCQSSQETHAQIPSATSVAATLMSPEITRTIQNKHWWWDCTDATIETLTGVNRQNNGADNRWCHGKLKSLEPAELHSRRDLNHLLRHCGDLFQSSFRSSDNSKHVWNPTFAPPFIELPSLLFSSWSFLRDAMWHHHCFC